MIRKLEDRVVMTAREAREKHEGYYIGFYVTSKNLMNPDKTTGYVVYLADSKDEIYKESDYKENRRFISILTGHAVGGIEIGGVQFV